MKFIHTGLSFEYLCLAITTYIFVNDNLPKKKIVNANKTIRVVTSVQIFKKMMPDIFVQTEQ